MQVGNRPAWRLMFPSLATRACRLASALTCVVAAACASVSQPPPEVRPEERALVERCERGDAMGCEELALSLLPDESLFAEPDVGRDAQALAAFERGCELGAADSCLRLGGYRVYHRHELAAGRQLLGRMCFTEGDDRACAMLADFAGDVGAAAKACELGRNGACLQHAVLLYERSPGDAAEALGMVEHQCQQGVAAACQQRALWSRGHDGDPIYWFSAACDRGLVEACERKVVLLFDDAVRTGEEAPCGEIALAAAQACAAELPGACLLREFCKSADVAQPLVESSTFVCGDGSGLGCYLQLLLESGQASETTFPNFDAKLLPQLEQACDSRYLPACMAAARLQLDGAGSRGPKVQAIRSLEYGCRQDYGIACYYLAPVYVQSAHAPRNLEYAVSLMQTACDQSVLDACERVDEWRRQSRADTERSRGTSLGPAGAPARAEPLRLADESSAVRVTPD